MLAFYDDLTLELELIRSEVRELKFWRLGRLNMNITDVEAVYPSMDEAPEDLSWLILHRVSVELILNEEPRPQ